MPAIHEDEKVKVNFNNPYVIKKNLIIKLYSFFRSKSFNSYFLKLLAYAISVILRRVLFQLMTSGYVGHTLGSVYGKDFSVRSLNSQFHSAYFNEYKNCYEPEVFAVIDLFLPENGVLVDVGSNWGHHAFLSVLNKNASVLCFEPNKMVFDDLVQISNDLCVSDKLIAFNLGVGSSRGTFELVQSRFESGLASVSKSFNTMVKTEYKLWPERLVDLVTMKKDYIQIVNIVTLDSKLEKLGKKVDVIKLDCEGVEYDALVGCQTILSQDKPCIIFELHTGLDGVELEKFKNLLNPIGYKFYDITYDLDTDECHFKELAKVQPQKYYNILATEKSL